MPAARDEGRESRAVCLHTQVVLLHAFAVHKGQAVGEAGMTRTEDMKGVRIVSALALLVAATAALSCALRAVAQQAPPAATPPEATQPWHAQSTDDYNRRLFELDRNLGARVHSADEYRIGPDDLLNISVFEAPELNRTVRVAASGTVSLPLIGTVPAAGLTPREMESALEMSLRKNYMKDPHVGVFVQEMQSHAVSVFGAVKRPGVFQIRGPKTLVEMLSLAEGLTDDAGDTVLVIHQAAPAEAQSSDSRTDANQPAGVPRPGPAADLQRPAEGSASQAGDAGKEEVNLKSLLESGDQRFNVLVYPGDVVKVTRAGIVYVVGEVKKPGGFVLKSNENISVLQAIALAEGLTRTSAGSLARIIRTDEVTGGRKEIPINIGKVLSGKAADPALVSRDILFIPNSAGRSALYRGMEAAISIGTGYAIYRR